MWSSHFISYPDPRMNNLLIRSQVSDTVQIQSSGLLQPRLNRLERNSQRSQVLTGKICLPAYLKRIEEEGKLLKWQDLALLNKIQRFSPCFRGSSERSYLNLIACWVFLSCIKWRCVPQERVQQFILIRFRSQRASLNFYFKKFQRTKRALFLTCSFSPCWWRTGLISVDSWG